MSDFHVGELRELRHFVRFCQVTLLAVVLVPPLAAADPLFPHALRSGDTIAFVAPARPLRRASVELARRRLEEQGFKVRVPADIFRQDGYLAGTDEQRAREVMKAFLDDSVAAVFPGTGGFGTTRMLDGLDYDLIARNPKILIGFSDITGLHLAIHKKTGLVTFHSPNPDGGLGRRDNLPPFSAHWFYRAILADRYPAGGIGYVISHRIPSRPAHIEQERVAAPITLHGGKAQGRLVGGNLSLIAALMGTPYEIETAGRVLFLEDIGEAPYRVDRMLSTLRLAGKLDGVAAVVLGRFTRRPEEDTSSEEVTIRDVLRDYFADLGVPVMAQFPFGHHRHNATLPLGVLAEVDAEQGSLRLLENPVQLLD